MLKSATLVVLGLTLASAACNDAAAEAGAPQRPAPIKNIVLVHGAFVDGSGWAAVHTRLENDGCHVSLVQNGLTSLADDVAMPRRVLDVQDGPAIHESKPADVVARIEQAARLRR